MPVFNPRALVSLVSSVAISASMSERTEAMAACSGTGHGYFHELEFRCIDACLTHSLSCQIPRLPPCGRGLHPEKYKPIVGFLVRSQPEQVHSVVKFPLAIELGNFADMIQTVYVTRACSH